MKVRRLVLACLLASGCKSRASHAYIPNFDADELVEFGAHRTGSLGLPPDTTLPLGPLLQGKETPMLAGSEPASGERPGRRSSEFRPDRVTELAGTLGYYAVFSPSVAPFKRVSALDAVRLAGDVPVLVVSSEARSEVPVLGDAAEKTPGRQLFWGSVVLDFRGGELVPLPSVSPQSRILQAFSEPPVKLVFERDAADNYFVRAPGSVQRQVRLNYLMDAPRSYFSGELPQGPLDALRAEVQPLPRGLRRAALKVAKELGVEPEMPAAQGLRALVAHFRGFEESREPPADTGSIYRDLSLGKRGVCRHRAYAFVITAQALGVPARFLQNEAHAWVEVKLLGTGWVRIDLGGAAEGLDPRSATRGETHTPGPDPWPRPAAFEDSYRRAQQLAAEYAQRTSRGPGLTRRAGDGRALPTLAAGQGLSSEPPVEDGRAPTFLHVTHYTSEVMRGERMELAGFARDAAGLGLAGLRIEVSLASPAEARAVLLGVSVTDAEGRFKARFTIPPTQVPEDYVLVVVTPGDAQHAAARAP